MVIKVTLVFQGLTLPWVISKLKLSEDKREVPADIQAQQIHLRLMKISLATLEEKHADLLITNTLVKTFKQKLENEVGITKVNIESLKANEEENELVSEYNGVLLDIGEFQHQKLSGLGIHQRYDEDIIRREEARIDLEQNKIG